jgi:hypothetical protein
VPKRRPIWPFSKRDRSERVRRSSEAEFLRELARDSRLSGEQPALDGQALVIRLAGDELRCDFVVEARVPADGETGLRLLVYLQNVSDAPLRIGLPEFLLTGGLSLPWHVGLRMMTNWARGEVGEVLMWDLQTSGAESTALLAAEIAAILETCRTIVAS